MTFRRHVLVIDNDRDMRRSIINAFEIRGYVGFFAATAEAVREIISKEHIHVAVFDIRLENDNEENQSMRSVRY